MEANIPIVLGDTRATTRRLSDMPTSVQDQFHDTFYEEDEEMKEEPESVLASAHRLVAKALGGGSRGEIRIRLVSFGLGGADSMVGGNT